MNHYSLSIQLSTSLLADKRSMFTIIEKTTIEFVTRVKDVQHILILSDILLLTLNLRSNLISVLKLEKKIIKQLYTVNIRGPNFLNNFLDSLRSLTLPNTKLCKLSYRLPYLQPIPLTIMYFLTSSLSLDLVVIRYILLFWIMFQILLSKFLTIYMLLF